MKKVVSGVNLIKLNAKIGLCPLYVSAGMGRSGSTLLFNMLREILNEKWGSSLSYAWEGDVDNLRRGKAYLIKTHDIRRYYRIRARHLFYTYRDVRVIAVSSFRKFNKEPSIHSIRSNINGYKVAKKACDCTFKYEDMITDYGGTISRLSHVFGINVNAKQVEGIVNELRPPVFGEKYSEKTLLYPDHITNTKDDEWREILSDDLQIAINNEFGWWFDECGYPTE